MESDLHIIGAFDTLARDRITDAEFEAELVRRGVEIEDAELMRERALLTGLLLRTPDGALQRGPEHIRRQQLSDEPADSQ